MLIPQWDKQRLSQDKEWVLMEVLLFSHVLSRSLNQFRLAESSKELLREPQLPCLMREFISRQGPVSQLSKSPQIELDRWLYPQWETKESNTGFPQPRNTIFNMSTMRMLRVKLLDPAPATPLLKLSTDPPLAHPEWATVRPRSTLAKKVASPWPRFIPPPQSKIEIGFQWFDL